MMTGGILAGMAGLVLFAAMIQRGTAALGAFRAARIRRFTGEQRYGGFNHELTEAWLLRRF